MYRWYIIATPSVPAEIFPDSMYSHLLESIHTIVARTEISVAMLPGVFPDKVEFALPVDDYCVGVSLAGMYETREVSNSSSS